MASQHIRITKSIKKVTKRKYRKSKTTKRGKSRYCNTCGHKV